MIMVSLSEGLSYFESSCIFHGMRKTKVLNIKERETEEKKKTLLRFLRSNRSISIGPNLQKEGNSVQLPIQTAGSMICDNLFELLAR